MDKPADFATSSPQSRCAKGTCLHGANSAPENVADCPPIGEAGTLPRTEAFGRQIRSIEIL